MGDFIQIAFIGLGTMGFPMAGHLSRAGHKLRVWNRTSARVELWLEQYEGIAATCPADAANGVDLVISCVGADADVHEVLLGPLGAVHGLTSPSIIVDHSTISAQKAQELAKLLAEQSHCFVDAPVSGGQQGAQAGTLSIMMGGREEACRHAMHLTKPYSRASTWMGPSGSGQLTKMINQICIAGLLQGLAEAWHFASLTDLNPEQVLHVISQGAASSWQMQNRSMNMVKGIFHDGFAVDWMRKDLGLCLDEARRRGASLPVTALVDQFYAELQAMGLGRSDTSSLIARLQHKGSSS